MKIEDPQYGNIFQINFEFVDFIGIDLARTYMDLPGVLHSIEIYNCYGKSVPFCLIPTKFPYTVAKHVQYF